jgi:hypothetical protein
MDRNNNVDQPARTPLSYATPPIVALVSYGALVDMPLLQCGQYLAHAEATITQVHPGFGFQGEIVL